MKQGVECGYPGANLIQSLTVAYGVQESFERDILEGLLWVHLIASSHFGPQACAYSFSDKIIGWLNVSRFFSFVAMTSFVL